MTFRGAEWNGFLVIIFENEMMLCLWFQEVLIPYNVFYKVLELACYDLYKKYVKLVTICHDFRIDTICDDLEFLTWFLINACHDSCEKLLVYNMHESI